MNTINTMNPSLRELRALIDKILPLSGASTAPKLSEFQNALATWQRAPTLANLKLLHAAFDAIEESTLEDWRAVASRTANKAAGLAAMCVLKRAEESWRVQGGPRTHHRVIQDWEDVIWNELKEATDEIGLVAVDRNSDQAEDRTTEPLKQH